MGPDSRDVGFVTDLPARDTECDSLAGYPVEEWLVTTAVRKGLPAGVDPQCESMLVGQPGLRIDSSMFEHVRNYYEQRQGWIITDQEDTEVKHLGAHRDDGHLQRLDCSWLRARMNWRSAELKAAGDR